MRRPTERRWVPWPKWCQENHLSLNIDKTKELVVDYRRQSREHTPITIDKTPVERVTSFKSSAFTSPRISHGLLTQMQCWRRQHQRLLLPETAEEVWNEPQNPQVPSTPALWRASWPAVSPPGLETAPLATAGLCKGSCELPATLLEVSFPPSRISTPGGVQGKPRRIIKDSSHPSHRLLSLLPSGRRFRSIRSRTSRLRDSFFPQAIRLMNSHK